MIGWVSLQIQGKGWCRHGVTLNEGALHWRAQSNQRLPPPKLQRLGSLISGAPVTKSRWTLLLGCQRRKWAVCSDVEGRKEASEWHGSVSPWFRNHSALTAGLAGKQRDLDHWGPTIGSVPTAGLWDDIDSNSVFRIYLQSTYYPYFTDEERSSKRLNNRQ